MAKPKQQPPPVRFTNPARSSNPGPQLPLCTLHKRTLLNSIVNFGQGKTLCFHRFVCFSSTLKCHKAAEFSLPQNGCLFLGDGLSMLQLLASKTFAEKALGLGWSNAHMPPLLI